MHFRMSDSEWISQINQIAAQVARESVEKALAGKQIVVCLPAWSWFSSIPILSN